jgi:aminoglycoside phosphotransferase (APT) family kinase protein
MTMHAGELPVSAAVVRELIGAQFPRWRGRPVRRVSSPGTVNAVFRVGGDLAARFPLRGADAVQALSSLESEAAAARELAPATRFPVPQPVALGEPGPGYPLPWSVQTWLPGVTGDVADPGRSAAFAADLAEFIAGVRAVGTRGRTFAGSGRGGGLTDHDEWMAACLRASAGLLDVPRLTRLWAAFRELPREGPDVMSHGDLTPGNVLVAGGRLAGVLDVGSFGAADPALDLISAWNLLDSGPRQVLRDALRCPDLEWERSRAWAFEQAMGLVWYYAESNPVMSRLGRVTLDRILSTVPEPPRSATALPHRPPAGRPGYARRVSVPEQDLSDRTAEIYRAFAAEARGRSPQYEELALAVAADQLMLEFLAALPAPKRQPNLLFAAARYLLGEPPDRPALRALISDRGTDLASTMLSRRTQTNEAARCATLLPALALLPQPLALIEVGASAGLTLLPDRYSYDYHGHQVAGTDPGAPVLHCRPRGPVPLPARVPDVAWRAGLDLNPLEVTSDADVRWLECLIWPGEDGRLERLRAAVETARRDPPPVYRGDLLTDVPALVRQAPRGATVVVYHSAVLGYVRRAQRGEFAATVAGLGVTWLANEAPGVLPVATVSEAGPHGFVLARNGTEAIALTDGHGTWVEWLP